MHGLRPIAAIAAMTALLVSHPVQAEGPKQAVFQKYGYQLNYSVDAAGRVRAGNLTKYGSSQATGGEIWRQVCADPIKKTPPCVWKLVSGGGVDPVLKTLPPALLDKTIEFSGEPGSESFKVEMYESPSKVMEFAKELQIDNYSIGTGNE